MGRCHLRDQHSSIKIIRIITPLLFTVIIAVVFYMTSIVPRILQANAPAFSLHNRNFIGTWYTHADVLTIRQDGHAHFTGRAYRWCIEGPPPCDKLEGNTIIPGLQKEIVFSREQGDTLYGTITSSTDHTNGQSITARLGPNDTLNLNGQSFCGPQAPLGTCGV
jgi:hypothetical protein